MTTKTSATLFSGIGGSSQGLKSAGFIPQYAIDSNQGAVDIYRLNHDTPITLINDVRSVDYDKLPPVNLLQASPVCKNYSNAKTQRQETPDDLSTAIAVVSAARHADNVLIENVPGYYGSTAFAGLKKGLVDIGFIYNHTVRINAADYGNPASRDRGYGMFSRKNFSVTLPERRSKNWADVLLDQPYLWIPSILTDKQLSVYNGLLKIEQFGLIAIDRCGYYEVPKVHYRSSHYPCIKAHSHHDGKKLKHSWYGNVGSYRSYMDFVYNGQSYSVTPRLLGLLNGFPLEYNWGEMRNQAATGIGNCAVPDVVEMLANCFEV
jgi:site-specific DNA-cytosine methylase